MPKPSQMKFQKWIAVILGFLVVFGVFYFLKIDWRETWAQMQKVSAPSLAIIFTCTLLQYIFIILRIRALFEEHFRPSAIKTAESFSLGQLLNLILPAKAGEVLKVALLVDNVKNRTLSIVTGVFLADRLIDIATLFALSISLYFFTDVKADEFIQRLGLTGSGPFKILIFSLVGISAVGIFTFYFLKKKKNWAEELKTGFVQAFKPKQLGMGLFFASLAWILEAYCIFFLANSTETSLTYSKACLALLIVNAAIAIPVTAANLGTYEAGFVFVLSLFGVASAAAMALATLLHLIQITVMVLLGVIFWIRYTTIQGQNLMELAKAKT